MLGIEDYGSDVESDNETQPQSTSAPASAPQSSSSLASKLPPPSSNSTFSLPPPKSSTTSSLALTLPPPSNASAPASSSSSGTKAKRPKKITINLPSLPPDVEEDEPPAKKLRVAAGGGPGAGKSSLLGMLPAPKQALPVKENKEERVLGGGGGPGLVFRATKPIRESMQPASDEEDVAFGSSTVAGPPAEVTSGHLDPSTTLVPLSLTKGKSNISLDDSRPPKVPAAAKPSSAPGLDFFSLGSSSSSLSTTSTPSTSVLTLPTTSSAPSTSSTSVSAAPSIPTFRPPSPTLNDPYPGYYQLPSGGYAPYDADYYASYSRKWQAEYDKQIRALEKSQYNPEMEGMHDVDMTAEMEKARREIQEREERKALTAGNTGKTVDGEPEMPKMNVKGVKLGAVARSRHQLTTLLTDAYLNRDALEEKIAQARRNRKEAGNKYGF